MVDSRLRIPPPRLVEVFVEVFPPHDGKEPAVKRFYPQVFEDREGTLEQVPRFCYPCQTDSPGVQYFTFVLTDIDGKFRFGFCRYPPHATSCICLISYVPWYEMFYVVLNNIQELELKGNKAHASLLLDQLMHHAIPDPGSNLTIEIECKEDKKTYKYDVPDTTKLPSIPASRNLTEYFAAITPEIMIQIFVSMLFERRILVTSKRLSLLTAVVHGSVSLLYPMQWQHIYVPVLPPHLIDYCCAPMPFLLGVHSSMMKNIQDMPLDEVVIVDADSNTIEYPFDDMDVFPHDVYSKLLSRIKKTEKALEDYVATQFLKALVALIGGYRDALVFKDSEEGGSIIFQGNLFLESRSSNMRPFLEFVLSLQSFQQFIASRLDMLNSGIGFADVFEEEVTAQSNNYSKHKTQYQQWMNKMKKGGGALRRSFGESFVYLKAKASDVELKDKLKGFYKGAKSGVKTGYKGAKSHFKDVRHYLKPKDSMDGDDDMKARSNPGSPMARQRVRTVPVKRQSSMPSVKAIEVKGGKFRHTVYSSMPPERVYHRPSKDPPTKPRTPPPRPPPPAVVRKSQSNDALEKRATMMLDTPTSSASSTPPMARPELDDDIPFDMLVDIETIKLEEDVESTPSQTTSDTGTVNPAFNVFDDSFCIIGDEAEQMNSPRDVIFHPRPVIPLRPDIIPDNKSHYQSTCSGNIVQAEPSLEIPDLMRFDKVADMDTFVLISPDKETAELSLADLLTDTQTRSQGATDEVVALSPVGPIFPRTGLFDETVDCVSPETRSFLFNIGNSPDITLSNHHPSGASKDVDLLGNLTVPKTRPPLPKKPAFLIHEPKKSPAPDPFEDLIIQTKSTINKSTQ